jgi:hypothetical protein
LNDVLRHARHVESGTPHHPRIHGGPNASLALWAGEGCQLGPECAVGKAH